MMIDMMRYVIKFLPLGYDVISLDFRLFTHSYSINWENKS